MRIRTLRNSNNSAVDQYNGIKSHLVVDVFGKQYQFAKRDSRKSCSRYSLFYILYATYLIRMGSDLKEISMIKMLKGDDEKPFNSMTLINMIEYFRNFRSLRSPSSGPSFSVCFIIPQISHNVCVISKLRYSFISFEHFSISILRTLQSIFSIRLFWKNTSFWMKLNQ